MKFLANLGWTRDDTKWVVLQWLSIATLITSGTLDLNYWAGYLGLPLGVTAQHWIIVLSAVTLWVSGKSGNSSLPGKNDAPAGRVSPSKFPPAAAILLAVALGGAAVTFTGCAKAAPVIAPTTAAKYLSVVQKTGDVVAAAQAAEIVMYQAGDISPALHAKIQTGFADASQTVLTAINTLNAAGTGDGKAVVQAVSDAVKKLVPLFAQLSAKQAVLLSTGLDTAAALIDLALAS